MLRGPSRIVTITPWASTIASAAARRVGAGADRGRRRAGGAARARGGLRRRRAEPRPARARRGPDGNRPVSSDGGGRACPRGALPPGRPGQLPERLGRGDRRRARLVRSRDRQMGPPPRGPRPHRSRARARARPGWTRRLRGELGAQPRPRLGAAQARRALRRRELRHAGRAPPGNLRFLPARLSFRFGPARVPELLARADARPPPATKPLATDHASMPASRLIPRTPPSPPPAVRVLGARRGSCRTLRPRTEVLAVEAVGPAGAPLRFSTP